MKILISQLAQIIINLGNNMEVNFSKKPDSDFWGAKTIPVFEGEVVLMGYYGGIVTNMYNIHNHPEAETLIEFLCQNLECTKQDFVYYKLLGENFTPQAEIEQAICSETADPATLVRSLFYVIRDSKKGNSFSWMWPGEARNNPEHIWYKSKDHESFIKELTGVLRQYAPAGYYFGAKNGNLGYWRN